MIRHLPELFNQYGYRVEAYGALGHYYVADNGIYCIHFIKISAGVCYPDIMAITFRSQDRKAVEKYYEDKGPIVRTAYSDYIHDCLPFEVVEDHVTGTLLSVYDVEKKLSRRGR